LEGQHHSVQKCQGDRNNKIIKTMITYNYLYYRC
jgi:hypothetical protein